MSKTVMATLGLLTALALTVLPVDLPAKAQEVKPVEDGYMKHLHLQNPEQVDPIEIGLVWSMRHPYAKRMIYTTTESFADALASGALLGLDEGGSVTYVDPHQGINQKINGAFLTLRPQEAIILGGPNAVSPELEPVIKDLGFTTKVTRITGDSRIQTSINLAKYTGAKDSTVLIARADDYADALAAGAFAGKTGYPILLAPKPYTDASGNRIVLHPDVAAYLKETKIQHALVIGGDQAVTPETVNHIKRIVPDTQRVAGASRVETADLLAERWPGSKGRTLIEGYQPASIGFHSGFAAVHDAVTQDNPIKIINNNAPLDLSNLYTNPEKGHGITCGPLVRADYCQKIADTYGLFVSHYDYQRRLNKPGGWLVERMD